MMDRRRFLKGAASVLAGLGFGSRALPWGEKWNGVEEEGMWVSSLSSGPTRRSAVCDLGEGASPGMYEWRASVQFATPAMLNESIDFYLATESGSELKNMQYLGCVLVADAKPGETMWARGTANIPERNFTIWAVEQHSGMLDKEKSKLALNPTFDEWGVVPVDLWGAT